MIIQVTSNKYGTVEVLLDDKDFDLLPNKNIYLWGSKKHRGIYAVIWVNGKAQKLHRIILGVQPGEITDHINGDPLDNRRDNLRLTNQSGNNKNSCKRKSATSKYKGVHFYRPTLKWACQIQCDKVKIFLGYYDTEVQAALTYNEAAMKYHGEYAKLNEIN